MMKKSITPSEIRQTNRQRIYQYIYQKESVAQQDIAYDLHLSRPTITTNLNALKEEGLIREAGQIENEVVGRKPSAYAIQPQYRVSIGVELLSHLIKIIAIDLYGRKIDRTVFAIDFQPTDADFKAV
ncbi:winged helix-turn-helix transcriptional regulator, partial [Mitsuokella sp.]|uniref:winged helix-turn-helix transcriptional regulator n=1 Tax=Mitsuokella sp. TaxID=2049034 RepID=UPI003D7D773E